MFSALVAKPFLVGLDGQTPLSLLDTNFGIRMIMNELGRLEHGVYS
ncbi:MAG: DUF2384 domain-containing protein [Bacteroidetes bacterium]|nr:DUF2384 domain-containing protein [Bacteroidota bacterium]